MSKAAAAAAAATTEVAGKSPVTTILVLVLGTVGLFLVVNVALWYYAVKNAPLKPKKKIGVKKAKREKLKMGVQTPGE